jgi:hypothetical protein
MFGSKREVVKTRQGRFGGFLYVLVVMCFGWTKI